MEEHASQPIFYKEMRLADFIVLLKFHPQGYIDGSFTVITNHGKAVYEIQNGIYLQIEKKLMFSFSVEWWIINKNSASTFFYGHFLEEQARSKFDVDWLLIIKSGAGTINYTKKGEFSFDEDCTIIKQSPIPSYNIELFFKYNKNT